MKKWIVIISVMFLLSACIVKSLHPFYTPKDIVKGLKLEGLWEAKTEVWQVFSVSTFMDSIAKDLKMSPSDKKEIDATEKLIYENAFVFVYSEDKQDSLEKCLLAIPFCLGADTLVDFKPFFSVLFPEGYGNITNYHNVGVHSLAKLNRLSEGKIQLSWLASSALEDIIKENRIKIKYELIGHKKDNVLLTASTSDLQKFIKKYLSLHQDTLWQGSEHIYVKQ